MNKLNFIKNTLIGKGQFGEVYSGIYIKTKELVALKYLKVDDLYINGGDYLINTIKTEEENMKKCECLNSVKCFGHYIDGDYHVMVMELCDGNLKNYVKKKGALPPEDIYDIFSQLNKAFKKMRSNNIIHRDLKLDNILFKYDKYDINKIIPKLTDFGFSKQLSSFAQNTGTIVGTNYLLPPEMYKNTSYNEKVDLWNLGIMLYMASLNPKTYNFIKKLSKNINQYERPRGLFLADLIDKLLVVNPDKRLSWEEYFNHPFFKYPKPNLFSTGMITKNFKCYKCLNAIDKKSKVLIKVYDKNKCNVKYEIFDKELELFMTQFNKDNNVLELLQHFEYFEGKDELKSVFIYNLDDSYLPLTTLCSNGKITKECFPNIVKSIFELYKKASICNPYTFLSIYSFIITNKGKMKLIDFGLNKYFLYPNKKELYFAPNLSEMDKTENQIKTNVMNFGMTIFLLFNRNEDFKIQKNFILQSKYEINQNILKLINKCTCPDINQRPTFDEINIDEFLV